MLGSLSTVRVLRRRPLAEQRIIKFLRCKNGSDGFAVARRKTPLKPFRALRSRAVEAGLTIHASGTTYASGDELQLVAWIARAQRSLRTAYLYNASDQLNAAIFSCADSLASSGILLPPITRMAAGQISEAGLPAGGRA